VFQIVSSLGVLGEGSRASGVAYGAHIGGFIAGLVLVKPFAAVHESLHGERPDRPSRRQSNPFRYP
jgi:membrane associated rhomboid family serine protease